MKRAGKKANGRKGEDSGDVVMSGADGNVGPSGASIGGKGSRNTFSAFIASSGGAGQENIGAGAGAGSSSAFTVATPFGSGRDIAMDALSPIAAVTPHPSAAVTGSVVGASSLSAAAVQAQLDALRSALTAMSMDGAAAADMKDKAEAALKARAKGK
jgi:hypothetical protein